VVRSWLTKQQARSATPPPALEMTVAVGAREQISYRILPRERGDVRMGRLFVRYQSRFGFAERWTAAQISQTIRVLPDLEEARRHALYLIRSKQVEMEKRRRRQRGQGREFESLRDYRQGDDLRDICWTATARRHNLTTRVFEIERSQVVWIVLDAGRLLRAQVQREHSDLRLSKLDYAINAALSLAQVATQCGDKVGLLAYGGQFSKSSPRAAAQYTCVRLSTVWRKFAAKLRRQITQARRASCSMDSTDAVSSCGSPTSPRRRRCPK
jgi:uncharacterized protein (DUF58 family)